MTIKFCKKINFFLKFVKKNKIIWVFIQFWKKILIKIKIIKSKFIGLTFRNNNNCDKCLYLAD